jgi:hypothetical protein
LLKEAAALSPRHRVGKDLADLACGPRKPRGDEANTNPGFGASRQCLAGSDSKKPIPDFLNQAGRGVLNRKDSVSRGSRVECIEYILEGLATTQRNIVPQQKARRCGGIRTVFSLNGGRYTLNHRPIIS